MHFLVSAGEASSDMYAAGVLKHLSATFPHHHYYGCAGPKLQAAGVEPIIDASKLAVVGLAEVALHLPRIYSEYRKLLRFTRRHLPVAALLTDSPDFHLRLARHLKRLGVPVFYLVAPQVWAWRENRVKIIRQRVDRLFCLFPFEEPWFRARGVNATYIGHPLATMVRRQSSRGDFFAKHGLSPDQKLISLLPGSRAGEACRHMPVLLETVALLREKIPVSFVLATPEGFETRHALQTFREPMNALSIKVVENETWDSIGHSDLALAASGTVTIEAAVLGTPMVTFYRVNDLSWRAGRHLVKAPFLTMVNLVGGRRVVPELIQSEMTPANLASAALDLLTKPELADQMRRDLAQVKTKLTSEGDPLERAAGLIGQALPGFETLPEPHRAL